jgi:plasmid stabilization system protein ParE
MRKYIITISDDAAMDIYDLIYYIRDELSEPLTARRYHDKLIETIQKLSIYAGSIAISQSNFIQSQYGPNARRVNFKKLAIIYIIDGDYVYIQRIIPGSLIY